MKNKINVVIVNYNTSNLVLELLTKLTNSILTPDCVFVVDNCSTDNSYSHLKYELPTFCEERGFLFRSDSSDSIVCNTVDEGETGGILIKLIKAKENRGFAAGNNIVLNSLLRELNNKEDRVWILNPDTKPDERALYELEEKIKSLQGYIVGSVLVNQHEKVQCFGGAKLNKLLGIPKGIYKGVSLDDLNKLDLKTVTPDFVNGASMYLTVETLSKIGVMPEDYFLYWEEADWCTQAKRKGIKFGVAEKSIVYHYESSSVGLRTPFQYKIDMKNTLKYFKRFYPIFIPMIFVLKPIINTISFSKNTKSVSLKPLYWSYLGLFKGYDEL